MVGLLVRFLKVFAFGAVSGVLTTLVVALVLWTATRSAPAERGVPDGPTLVEKVREVARLETLEVTTYKKLTYEVDPPATESLVESVANWAEWSAAPPVGRAIVFADVHVGLDLSRIDEESVRVEGDVVTIVLPPLQTRVELRPGETEVVRSNLDSAETAELLDRAKWAILADVSGDARLAERARESARRALRGLLLSTGFREVVFVEELPVPERAAPLAAG